MSAPKDTPQEQHEVGALAEETITDLDVTDEEAAEQVRGDGSVGVGTAEPSYTAISNVMKTKHDTVKNSISNVR